MLGQLQDAGNATTLAHYLELLSQCGLITGLQKYSGKKIRQKASSPKLIVQNTALMNALSEKTFSNALEDRNFWGRLVETAVGAHLLNTTVSFETGVYYWRHVHEEVDFILKQCKKLLAVEVKSGRKKETLSGIEAF